MVQQPDVREIVRNNHLVKARPARYRDRHPIGAHAVLRTTSMKRSLLLTITSLLSIIFVTFHLTGDTLRARPGTPEAGGSTLVAVPILVVWLYGTLVLTERRSGHVIMLIGSLIALAMPVFHVMGREGVFRGQLARSSADFLFVWTLHALGVTGMFSLILAACGLLNRQRAQP